MSLESVLVSIQNMLNFPNIESPANIDASVSINLFLELI
jgi:ubiquitin-protein ligase